MVEHHLKGPSMAERIAKRERNSGDPSAEHVVKQGDGARRTFHNIHDFGQHGDTNTNHPTDGRVANNPGAKSQQTGGNG